MAIVTNTATENGDIIQIQSTVPIIGLLSLVSFLDNTEGETDQTYFIKTFRYSRTGGLTWSSWDDLTLINIQNVSVERQDSFVVEYQYERTGDGAPLVFNEVTLSGQYSPLFYPYYENSIFVDFFGVLDVGVLEWALNVLEKLYEVGILATFINRGYNTDSLTSDEDFISFWYTFTHFFAIFVYYARQYESITGSELLLQELLNSLDVYTTPDADISELLYIFENYLDEIGKRGTVEIYSKAEDENDIDGELLRLLDYVDTDEFIFALTKPGELGWNLGVSSPMYYGTQFITNLIKGYEFTAEVVDLDNYPLVDSSSIEIEDDYMKIVNPSGDSGVGYDDDENKRIIIDPSIDYEISFRIKRDSGATDSLSNITFGLYAYDSSGNFVNLYSNLDGSITNDFFTDERITKNYDTDYWVRGILYNKDESNNPNDELNILDLGNNLRSLTGVVYIVPKILVDGALGSTTIYITDIKVRPLKLPYSLGMLASKNIIINYVKNNGAIEDSKFTNIVRNELVPYNCNYQPIFIE